MFQKTLFIFDMDGVLIESEPFWREAQIEVLRHYDVTISAEDCICYTMGKRIDDIARLWIKRFNLPVTEECLRSKIIEKAGSLIRQFGTIKPGINELITQLQHQRYRIALATSSSQAIIDAVIHRLKLDNIFELALSADDVPLGKPAPDVYNEVCRRLNVEPTKAIALEDSLTGVRSALAAGITTIAIPEFHSIEFHIADYCVSNINEVFVLLQNDH
ncbi:HAD family hydrolase [Vibrio sp. 10N.261.51.F12]|uniref:HAD family hydrolase n=1 Tax=Vibrio sp. 10N.261.51.F12 TaxID=3229679 RepID=UPI003552A8B2